MQVLIVMAGEGRRFKDAGYDIPKPFIHVKNRPIVEWTTRSLPFISHYGVETGILYELTVAMRVEHRVYIPEVRAIYGQETSIVEFADTTRGNLETALIATSNMSDNEPLLILDSDNAYAGKDVYRFFTTVPISTFAGICYFTPIDNSAKWCFAIMDFHPQKSLPGRRVIEVREKDSRALSRGGFPMVGTFYFSSVKLFRETAKEVMKFKQPRHGEFYMSQSIEYLLEKRLSVFGCKVDNVIPLGTPEDVERYGVGL